MNQTFGPEWEAGFKPEHHALTTLTGGSSDPLHVQTFVKLPLEGRTLLLHPYEGAVPPCYIDYRALHLKFRKDTRILENDRADSVVHLRSDPMADRSMHHYRYYKRFIEQTHVTQVRYSEYMDLTARLYSDNMERFKHTLSKYPYWNDAHECPVNLFYEAELRNNPNFRVDAIWHGDNLLAIRFYYDLPGQVFWARTLRTFDPAYASWKVGTAATVALIDSVYRYYGTDTEVHLGLEMEYKPATFKTCAAWHYESRLGVNLATVE